MASTMNRRRFLQRTAACAAGLLLAGRATPTLATSKPEKLLQISAYKEAPSLAQRVAAGELPPVQQRLADAPLVLTPIGGTKNYGGWIRTVTSDWPGGFMEESQYGHSPLRWINDGLGIAPGMCDAWSTNADNTQWTLHIREGLKWSDGVLVTVDDILFWWNDLIDANYPGGPDAVPDFGFDSAGGMAIFSRVNDSTLRIIYANPAPLTIYRLAMWVNGNIGPRWIAPRHYLMQFHPKYNPAYTNFDALRDRILFRTNPECPSLDPWLCVQYLPQTATTPCRILWHRNPYYYAVDPDGNQLPYIDGWIEDGINDRVEQINRVKARKVDFLHFNSFLLSDIPELESGQAAGHYQVRLLDSGSGTGMIYYWNYDHPDPKKRALYRTPQFKQAMSLALNRPVIQAVVYSGYGAPTTGTMGTKALEYNFNNEARNRYIGYRDAYVNYDPVGARALLDSINVRDTNSDTWREYPDGTPLVISLDLAEPASPECLAVLNIALANWRTIGLNVQVLTMTSDELRLLWESGQGDMHTEWDASDGPNLLLYPSWMVPNEPQRWAPLCGNTLAARGTPWENTQCELSPWERTPPRYCAADPVGYYANTPVAQIHQIYLQAISDPIELNRIQDVWQMLDIHKDNVFYLGTVGNYPKIEIVSNNLGNVPTREQLALGGFVNPWIIPYPAIMNPETWSYKEIHRAYLPTVRK